MLSILNLEDSSIIDAARELSTALEDEENVFRGFESSQWNYGENVQSSLNTK